MTPSNTFGAALEREAKHTPGPLPAFIPDEESPLPPRLRGRAVWLLERGRIKDAELMESAAAELDMAYMGRALIAARAKATGSAA